MTRNVRYLLSYELPPLHLSSSSFTYPEHEKGIRLEVSCINCMGFGAILLGKQE